MCNLVDVPLENPEVGYPIMTPPPQRPRTFLHPLKSDFGQNFSRC